LISVAILLPSKILAVIRPRFALLEPRILSYGRSSPLFGVCSPRRLKCKLQCSEICASKRSHSE